jgi:hypothetical protein
MVTVRTRPQPKCPIRPGEACSLCVPGVAGPQDCGLVFMVMSDPDLREQLHTISLTRRALGSRDEGPAIV